MAEKDSEYLEKVMEKRLFSSYQRGIQEIRLF
jgi:hypothetical protein